MTESLQRMARYNRWMNVKLFAKVAELPNDAIAEDRDAFFGSILGTLNHVMVADLFWLHRFATNSACREALAHELTAFPTPASHRDMLFNDFAELTEARERLDALILDFSETWTPKLLAHPMHYRNMAREEHERPLEQLLQHLFNHQTHHRGQITHMLFHAGIDPGPTDLILMLMEEGND